MRATTHGVVGGMIMVSSPNIIIGAAGAFLSHFLLDYLDESSQTGDKYQDSAIDFSLFFFYVMFALHSPFALLALLGWYMGNLPDIIDKPRRWFFGKEEWFSCHGGKGLFQFRGHKLGHKNIYRLNGIKTFALDLLLTFLFCISCL